jgi:isoleucyl-tRNA synthetase
MSKSAGNVLDPWELIESHGADALRWLMFAEGNPWVSRRVSHHLLDDVVRRFLLTLWNTHVFFTTYAAIDGFDVTAPAPDVADRPGVGPLDPRRTRRPRRHRRHRARHLRRLDGDHTPRTLRR